MVDWNKIAGKVSETIDKRGGPQSVEEDLGELETIAKGEGTVMDKLKAAGKALKEPGAHGSQPAAGTQPSGAPATQGPGAPGSSAPPPAQNG